MSNSNNTPKKKITVQRKIQQQVEKKVKEELKKQTKNFAPTKRQRSKNTLKNTNLIKMAPKVGMYKALMSDPTMAAFANVYTHPWSKLSARMPTFPVTATQLTRVRVWAQGVCNAQGYGWAVASVAPSVCNDQQAVFATNGPQAPNNFLGGTGADVGEYFSDSEYGSLTFQSDQKDNTGWNTMRPVAAGLRIKYTGTELNKSGLIYAIQNDPRATALDNYNVNNIVARPHKCYNFSNNEWHAITRHITDILDFQYQQYVGQTGDWIYETNVASEVTLDDYFNLGLLVVAQPGAPFEIEYVAHFEIKGKNLHRTAVVPSNTPGLEKTIVQPTMVRNKDNTTRDYSPVDNSGGSIGNMVKEVGLGLIGAML